MDDNELEQVVRAGLAQRAAETDVTAPVVGRARAEVGRRRRTRWGVVGAAAAAVVVIGGVAVATVGDGGEDAARVASDRTSTTSVPSTDVAGWRTEYWGRVAVDVPGDWGYGGAQLLGDGQFLCGPGGDPGYVGRPIVLTDVCTSIGSDWQPSVPYVWLGAGVDPGTQEWDNGYVQETIEVAGTTVTVGSDDAALRQAVLDSARDEHICPPERDSVPAGRRESTDEGSGSFREGAVCAYRKDGDHYLLAYARPLDEATTAKVWSALDEAPATDGPASCLPGEFVVVSSVYDDPYSTERELRLHWDAVFRTDCGEVDAGPVFFERRHKIVRLGDRVIDPWADDGVRSSLSYFIGPIG